MKQHLNSEPEVLFNTCNMSLDLALDWACAVTPFNTKNGYTSIPFFKYSHSNGLIDWYQLFKFNSLNSFNKPFYRLHTHITF